MDMDVPTVCKDTTVVEMYPRWFHDVEPDEDCYVCARGKSNKTYERGTFGVVTPGDHEALKVIPSRKNVLCSSALRELTAYSLLGTACDQVTRVIGPPVVDSAGNVTIKLERAHSSLLNFSRCFKVRRTLPGFEHMSVHFVLWSLLRGVAYMNQCHLMHRDIKPGNVLVFPGPRVALCDLGGTRIFSDTLEPLEAEMSDTVCTKIYAPPEEASRHHHFVFDSFSIAATVIHYAMSFAPCYRPLNKVNRKTFTKLCKPYPALLALLRLLIRCDPSQRYTAEEALRVFEDVFPELVQKYKQFTVTPPCTPSRLLTTLPVCTWGRYHEFSSSVWPAVLQCIHACQAQSVEKPVTSVETAVAFYVLNMLQNIHSLVDQEVCTEERCYIMLIPGFIRTASLMVGNADDTEDYLSVCHTFLQKHRCVKKNHCHYESYYAASKLFAHGMNWVFPPRITCLLDVQNELRL